MGTTVDVGRRVGQLERAGVWLLGYLERAGGSAPAGEVLAAAGRAGFAQRTVQRARERAGVRSVKRGARWFWSAGGVSCEGAKTAGGDHPLL